MHFFFFFFFLVSEWVLAKIHAVLCISLLTKTHAVLCISFLRINQIHKVLLYCMYWVQCSTVKDTNVRKSRNVFDVISISCEISVWEVGNTVKPSLNLDRPKTWAEGVSLHIIKWIQRSVLTKWCQIPPPLRSNLGQGLEKREGETDRQTDRVQ